MIIKNALALLLSCPLSTASLGTADMGSTTGTAPMPPTVQRLKVEGSSILLPDGSPIELRGLNWGWWGTAQPQDAGEAAAINANVIRMPIRWYFTGDKSSQPSAIYE